MYVVGDDSAPTQMTDAASPASSKILEEWRLEMNLPKEVDRTNAASPHIENGKQSLHESGLSPVGKPHRQYGVEMLAWNGWNCCLKTGESMNPATPMSRLAMSENVAFEISKSEQNVLAR